MKTRVLLARARDSVPTISSGEGASLVPVNSLPKALSGSLGGPNGIPPSADAGLDDLGGMSGALLETGVDVAERSTGSWTIRAADVVAPRTTNATSVTNVTDLRPPLRISRAARFTGCEGPWWVDV
jgi:hypothetical protein